LGGDGCSAIARQGRGGAGHAAVAWRCAFSFRFGPNGLLLGLNLSRATMGCGIWHWGDAKAAGAWPCGVDARWEGVGIWGEVGWNCLNVIKMQFIMHSMEIISSLNCHQIALFRGWEGH
jgi:hypothetical protein